MWNHGGCGDDVEAAYPAGAGPRRVPGRCTGLIRG